MQLRFKRTEDSKVKIRFNSPRLWMTLVGKSSSTETKKQYSSVESQMELDLNPHLAYLMSLIITSLDFSFLFGEIYLPVGVCKN